MDSNTGQNRPANKGQFRKGDVRINRKGRPKSFDALRELAQQIAHEQATDGDEPLIIDGHGVTVVEKILRQWGNGSNPKEQQGFLEIAFGKVPTNIDVTSNGESVNVIGIQVVAPDAAK